MLEAARIDGASEAKTFIDIVLPMVKPGIGALAIFTFINSWNDYFMQLVMLASSDVFTLPLGIATLQGDSSVDMGLLMAGAALAAVPIISCSWPSRSTSPRASPWAPSRANIPGVGQRRQPSQCDPAGRVKPGTPPEPPARLLHSHSRRKETKRGKKNAAEPAVRQCGDLSHVVSPSMATTRCMARMPLHRSQNVWQV